MKRTQVTSATSSPTAFSRVVRALMALEYCCSAKRSVFSSSLSSKVRFDFEGGFKGVENRSCRAPRATAA
jgi:hypothetical protein